MANIIQDGSYVLAADTEELKGFEQEKIRVRVHFFLKAGCSLRRKLFSDPIPFPSRRTYRSSSRPSSSS